MMIRRNRKGPRERKGFSIVETVLAIAILASSFMGLSYVLSNTTLQNSDLDVSTTAVLLARGAMEEAQVKSFSSLADVAATNFGGDFSRYAYSVDVDYVDEDNPDTVSGSATDMKRIIVAVTATNWAGTIQLHDLKANLE